VVSLLGLIGGRAWAQSGEPADEPGMAPQVAPAPSPPAAPVPAPASRPAVRPAAPAARQPPAGDSWYYAAGGTKAGPFTTRQMQGMIATGLLDARTPVWQPGERTWRPLGGMTELAVTLPPDKPAEGRQRIRGLIVGGSILFGITWSLAAIAAAGLSSEDTCDDCQSVATVLWVPVLGPALTNAVVDSGDATLPILTTFWTLAQAAGVTMLFFGIYGREPTRPEVTDVFQLTPLVGRVKGLSLSMSW